jgi:hypothetical protein
MMPTIAEKLFRRAAIAGVAVLLVVGGALAIEFKPYPVAQITPAQWTGYYDQVRVAHGGDKQEFPAERLIVFHDRATATSYAFTQAGHAAHPAWITRKIVQRGSELFVDQIGYFAGQEAPFAALYQQYQVLNQRMIEQMRKQAPK